MKKYLFMGLTILIATNIMILSGVAYNRMGQATTQLTLTERELPLPYKTGIKKENSAISLAIQWRVPSKVGDSYYPYQSKRITITHQDLAELGFKVNDIQENYWLESKELYWALEYDGAMHKAEIAKAMEKYQKASLAFQTQPSDSNSRKKKQQELSLAREKTSNSRLFFIELSADYQYLATKYSDKQNFLIIKGLAKPYYNRTDKNYSLSLKNMSVSQIMMPVAYNQVLSDLKNLNRQEVTLPRYAVNINWGQRLEPWVVNAKRLID